MKDEELDRLLAEYRGSRPTGPQMARWKRAVRAELGPGEKGPSGMPWLRLVAASLIGFLIGGLVFGFGLTRANENSRLVASADETFEFVYLKTE